MVLRIKQETFGSRSIVETPDIVYHLRRAKVSIAGR